MKKVLTVLTGVLALVAVVIVGGTFYAKHTIQTAIETAISESKKDPVIKDVDYSAITVDLLGNQVLIEDMTFKVDYGEYVKAYNFLQQDGIDTKGDMTMTSGLTKLSGIRAAVFQKDPVIQLVSTHITTHATISETSPYPSDGLSFSSKEKGPSNAQRSRI